MTFEQATDCFENIIEITARKETNYHEPVEKTGLISKKPEKCSGLWGYGGDSVAVYIDNEPFPLKQCKVVD